MASNCPLADQLHLTTLAQAPGWLLPLADILAEQRRLEGHPWPHSRIVRQLHAELNGGDWPRTSLMLAGDDIVGCVRLAPLAGHEQRGLWLSNLWVKPARRRQGLGRWLCEQQAAVARAHGFAELQLYTQSHAKFYSAMGWQTRRVASLRGRDCHVMRLALNVDVFSG